ncbi:tetraacyldisaccharide 4'-kinase [Polaromonas sp. YR568]|uniref:tetraacyldisaccharide 4'-kinase n=1 Tax=Polaromonas sp. YR568 TaxID=1855301 RepID=UPI003137B888
MKHLLLQAWTRRGWLACLLWPLSCVYAILVAARAWLYRSGLLHTTRFPVPVIVVGNVVAGGAGKTPVVISVVHHLQSKGLKVGVVSRGYGRTSAAMTEVTASTPLRDSGDEPALIHQATGAPVVVAANRAQAVESLLKAHPHTQVVVSDDGLQHLAMGRDINIAVFDDRGLGNGWLLPAGPLRESWPLKGPGRIDLVLHTGQRPAFDGFTSSRDLMPHGVAADGHVTPLAELAGQPLVAMAAIAHPEAFFTMLRARGLQLDEALALPDHHPLDTPDIVRLLSVHSGRTVLCTQKDAVKLFRLPAALGVRVLAVPLAFTPEPAFFAALDRLLAPHLTSAVSPLPS